MLLALSILLLIFPASFSAPVKNGCTTGKNKLLLISFDGFRWDYDRDVDTPNLDKMAEEGVMAEYVTPPFLTITSPTHFTLLSGRYIENHGVIHNIWFNTTTQEKKQYYMTQFVDEYWDNGSLPIWITAQRQGKKAGSLHFPGTAATYQKEIIQVREVEPQSYDYSNETEWRANVDKVMKEWFKDQDLDFVSLYFGEPDATGHKYGPDSPERREMVMQVDRTIGYIQETAQKHGLGNRLNIIITADHGMSTVLQGEGVNEIILTDIPGFSMKDLEFHLVDYGPAGLLLPKEGMLDKVYQALKGGHPNLHVYKKEDMPARLHYSNHPRLLPLILYADKGYVINGFYVFQNYKGQHGFDNEEMDMKPFFRAVGPDFHKNLLVGPFETVNVYSLMCHLLGIKPEINDGSLDNTRHMLISNGESCNSGGGSGDDSGGDSGDSSNSILHNVYVGLGAMAGFLLLTLVVFTSFKLYKRQKKQKANTKARAKDEDQTKDDSKQTAF
ncbi:ectonucleotide pyrophosphatase/phosphodiesterase family member 7-like [Labeo rohita]|uniref:ectonucleotide pyrophosphatase/phosphodiesterase family member 7-like n=1 Tax=Labeo rohita TaxID=84645 RepID=UPI0021E2DA8B|nr:ectonucleotide pyrophosphatase/phosphodiesterase family member 7-like [Labeo rohita]